LDDIWFSGEIFKQKDLIRLRRTRVNSPSLGAMINIAIDTPLLAAG
jgi:hypothetical protein